jgi:DNA processing protein
LDWAKRLGIALAANGWPVLSGLAEGIDGAAHRGCLEAGGVPVGVLATSLDRVYPRHHSQLQAEVAKQGLLITEQRPGAAVAKGHFASRNRLLVALAEAVVVVECPHGSGALHGARLAWAQELPLWVVPADTNRSSAKGSNSLLSQGATPLLDPADLLSSLGQGPLAVASSMARTTETSMDPLLEALGAGASLEQLAQTLDKPLPKLAERLLQLELAGLVEAAPGLRWRPRQNGLLIS